MENTAVWLATEVLGERNLPKATIGAVRRPNVCIKSPITPPDLQNGSRICRGP